jgi:hypothetical protein
LEQLHPRVAAEAVLGITRIAAYLAALVVEQQEPPGQGGLAQQVKDSLEEQTTRTSHRVAEAVVPGLLAGQTPKVILDCAVMAETVLLHQSQAHLSPEQEVAAVAAATAVTWPLVVQAAAARVDTAQLLLLLLALQIQAAAAAAGQMKPCFRTVQQAALASLLFATQFKEKSWHILQK